MPSLIERIVSLEKQASDIVEAAHAQAKSIAQQAEGDLENARAEIDQATTRRVEQYRAEAQVRLEEALAAAELEFHSAAASIERISDVALRSQLDQIVERVKEA